MKLLPISAILLLLLTGCDNNTPTPGPSTPAFASTAISIGEDGAPPYTMKEVQVSSSLYQSARAAVSVSGRLNDGTLVSINFKQSSTTVGADRTDLVDATINGSTIATQASGSTVRNPSTNAVSGTFSCRFPTGKQLDGVITNLQLL